MIFDLVKGSRSDPDILGTDFVLVISKQQTPYNGIPLTDDPEGSNLPSLVMSPDFANTSPEDLAKFTREHFEGEKGDVSDYYCIALDSRSAEDSTCMVIRDRVRDSDPILFVRMPFDLTGSIIGMQEGIGMIMEDVVGNAEENGDSVFRL